MTNYSHVQTQITSIMEIMTKSAIAEIAKLFEDSSSVLCWKITRSLNENEALKKLLQHDLRMAREQKAGSRENPVNTRSIGVQVLVEEQHREGVFGQECSFSLRRDGEPAGVEKSADMEKLRTEPVLLKQERLEEGLCYSDPQPTAAGKEQVTQPSPVEDGKKPDTEPTPVGDPEELSEQHRCGHGDEELSGLEFVVKTEREEEHVAQILDQSSCWASYVEEFDKMDEKPSVCSEELRSEAIHIQQGQYRERLVHTVERENQTLLPQQQQHGPSVKHMRGSESPAQPHSGSQYETGSTLSTSVSITMKKDKTDGQGNFGKKPFICTYCGKSFHFCSHLIKHHIIHTGEKPYSCAQCGKCFRRKDYLVQHERVHSGNKPYHCTQCGKRFSLKSNLMKHERIHSGSKPFGCSHCGKRFALGAYLRAHYRTHTGERPYHCTQCGKCFSLKGNLMKHHERIHMGVI